MNAKDHLQQLKSCDLFRDLSEQELMELYLSMVEKKLAAGEVLIYQGQSSDGMYILLSGRLLVKQADGKVIGQIGRGQTVGEMGIITNEVRSATVMAMRDSLLLKLDKIHFNQLWARHPTVLYEVTKMIAQRLQKTIKPRHKYNNESNIALLSANRQTDLKGFIEELSLSFDNRFRYKILKRSDFPEALSEDVFHQTIREFEHHYDYLFYDIESPQGEWADLCLGHADRILVLANGTQKADYDQETLFLLTSGRIHPEIKKILVLLYHQEEQPRFTESWLKSIHYIRYFHINLHQRDDFARLLRLLNGTAIGLVLGGGGGRVWAQYGVMKYIFENKIPIDAYVCTSGGAICGASIALARDFQECIEFGLRLTELIHFREYTLPFCSILSSKSITNALKQIFGETKIEDLKKMLICVSADLFRSEEVDIQSGLLWQAIRASAAIPGIYPPVYLESSEQLLIDGGVVNNLPVDIMKNYFEGFGKIIAVDIGDTYLFTERYDYPLELTWLTYLRQTLFGRKRKLKTPSIFNTFFQGLMLSSQQKVNTNALLCDIYIKPDLAGFPLLDFSKASQMLDIGYACAQKTLANWRTDLNL